MSTKALPVVVAAVAVLLMVDSAAAASFDWWNNSWHYRVNVTVNTSLYNRTDWPIEHAINFTDLGVAGIFDNNSVRVIEYNATNGNMSEIVSQFDKGQYYNNATNAHGEVVWLLNGTRPNHTILYYFIYFDSASWGPKQAPDYTSNLTFNNSGATLFWVNNSKIEVRVHTNHQDYTSGMEFAKLVESGTMLFDVSTSQKTIEYISYNDTAGNRYGYDLRDSFQVENFGPIRITVKQEGEEVDWGTITPSTEGNLTKRYTFYQNSSWIKIGHIFTAESAGIWRRASAITAPRLDIVRTKIQGESWADDSTEPFSWASVYNQSSPFGGIGVINLEETGTTDYTALRDSTTGAQKIGISLTSNHEFTSTGSSISETAAIYFHEDPSHDPVTELRSRFVNDTNVSQWSVEERIVALTSQTNNDTYNHNETIYIIGNITQDDFNLSYSANATLNDQLGNEVNLTLDKNGSIYNGSYKIDPANETGEWNLTVRVYDDKNYLLNTSVKTFTVTSTYVVDILILNPIALVNQTVLANVSVRTFRNDTGITGIVQPNISCAYYNVSNTSDVTAVTNISEGAYGNYSANWTAPEKGDWNFTCNVTWYNNTGTGNATFVTTVKNTTTLNVTLTTVTGEHNVSEVTWTSNQTFTARFNVTNIEMGLAKSVNVTINFTDTSWTVDNISNPYTQCGDILPLESCIVDFNVTVPAQTAPNIYNITANVTWENFIGTKNESSNWMNITVDSNPMLEIVQPSLNNTLPEDFTGLFGEFTVNSTGNDDLGTILFSCSSGYVCSNFAPVLTPSSITSGNGVTKGTWTNVSVNLTISDGQPPGSYTGIINASASGTWNDSIILNVTIAESRNWTINTMECFKAALPNTTGYVCEFEIDNTGNINLDFNITPYTNSTFLKNYTYSNETNFTVDANTTRTIAFRYNTTGSTNQSNTTIYIINATDPAAYYDNRTFNVTLDVVYGPDIKFFNISSQELAQRDNLTINVTIIDRLWAANDIDDIWVTANITWPNGTLIEAVNLTNETALTPGGTSNWSLDYNNTIYRDVNFGVIVFVVDTGGGYAESPDRRNFTVYAKLVMDVRPTRASGRYDPQESVNIRVKVNDSNFEPLQGVNVTVNIIAPDNAAHPDSPKNVITDENGTSTTTSFLVYEPTGDWKLDSTASYYDSLANKNVTANLVTFFKVDWEKEVSVQTDDTHYKGTNFPVKIYITQKGNLVNVSGNVTVELVYDSSVIQTVNATLMGDYYEATMSLDTNADTGAYLAKVYADDGAGEPYAGYKAFDVPEAPALALTLDISVGSTYKPGDTVLITAFLSDQNSQYINDSNITLTITDPDNNPTIMNMTRVSGTMPPKYTAEYNLSNDATLGAYTVFGNVTYNSVYTADVALFVASETLYTEVSMDPVVYLNRSMNITVTVINPITGQGIDADNLTLTLYNTTDGILQLWKTLAKGDFTPGDTGVYTYTETVDQGIAAGSYIALLEVKEGSYRVWGMQTFKIEPPLYYDVVIMSYTQTLEKGGFFEFTANITNKGDFLEEDITVKYRIDDGSVYSGQPFQIAILPTGQSQTVSRNFSSIDLAAGPHYIYVIVEYEGVPIASADEKFQITEGDVTPGQGGAPGGGGGGPAADKGIPKLSIIEFYPSEVHIERGGTTYLVVTVESLGGADVHDVSAHITGIPEEWFEVIRGEAAVLPSAESSDILIQIDVPETVAAQVVTLTVTATSTESSHERSLIMRIFSSRYELVYFEVESVKKTMRNSEDRSLVALKEGKNVSAVMAKIDEARAEIMQAETFLGKHEYEKALGHLDSAREVLEHVNKLLEVLSGEAATAVTPAPVAGIPTPLLMFMFIVTAALGAMVVYLARDKIPVGISTAIKARATPTMRKPKAKQLDPEVMAKSRRLKDEVSGTERLLKTVSEQHEMGLISDSTYKELRKRNEKKLKDAKSKLKKLGG